MGGKLKKKLFSGRQAVGETITIAGVRFTVIGTMDNKLQFSNYFSSDDESLFIPYTSAGDIWNTRYASVMVFMPVSPVFEADAMMQVRQAVGKRQGFLPTDKRAIQMFGRQEFRPVIDGITIGLKVLLLFIGILTLGIGGVGVMNIMLVSVNERVREIGLRMALGAKRETHPIPVSERSSGAHHRGRPHRNLPKLCDRARCRVDADAGAIVRG